MMSFTYLDSPLVGPDRTRVEQCSISPYLLPRYLELFRPDARPTWMLVHRPDAGDVPIAFTVSGRRLRIWSQTLPLSARELDLVCSELFGRFPRVRRVDVELVAAAPHDVERFTVELQQSEDFVADLPARVDEYLARLGTRTRKHAPYYVRRLRRELPDLRIDITRNAAIAPDDVARIVHLNRARMLAQGKVSGIDDTYLMRLQRLASTCGMVTTVRAGGDVIAGTICSEIAGRHYLHVIAHHDDYARFNPGHAVLLLTIEESIRAGSREFHFLWGEAEYKRRFLGTPRSLYSFAIFRSRADGVLGALTSRSLLASRIERMLRTRLSPDARTQLAAILARTRTLFRKRDVRP